MTHRIALTPAIHDDPEIETAMIRAFIEEHERDIYLRIGSANVRLADLDGKVREDEIQRLMKTARIRMVPPADPQH